MILSSKTIKQPKYYKTAEREFGVFLSNVVRKASNQYKREVIEGMHVSTIKKFSDAKQIGNYSSVFKKMADKTTKKIKKRYSFRYLRKHGDTSLAKQNKINQKQFYNQLSDAVGIDPKQLMKQDLTLADINALSIENAQWAEKHLTDSLSDWTSTTLKQMSLGNTPDDIIKGFNLSVDISAKHAKFVAKQQIAMYNSILTKKRAEKLGITKAIWHTTGDDKTRPSHKARNDKEFDLNEGLLSSLDGKYLLPAQDYRCRCTMTLVIPDDL